MTRSDPIVKAFIGTASRFFLFFDFFLAACIDLKRSPTNSKIGKINNLQMDKSGEYGDCIMIYHVFLIKKNRSQYEPYRRRPMMAQDPLVFSSEISTFFMLSET